MALIRPIPSGTETPDTMTFTTMLSVAAGAATYQTFLNLTSDEVAALNAMGYNYVTTTGTAKTAIATGTILLASVSSSNVNAVITFSKT